MSPFSTVLRELKVPRALRKWGPFGTHSEEQRELGQNDEKIQNGAEI